MSAQDTDPTRMTDEERERLRRAFNMLPKVEGHGESALERHDNILPEWIIQIVTDPYERYETYTRGGERRTIVNGRVPESPQWITVEFVGDPESGRFLTSYQNRKLEREYGGRPWRNK